MEKDPSGEDLRAAYRTELYGARMQRSAKTGTLVLFVINSLTVIPDYWFHREVFELFLAVRLALNAVLAFIYFRLARTHPVGGVWLGCLAGGGMLLTVVFGTGGPASHYYAGLLLLLMGLPVLVPLPAFHVAVIESALVLGFAVPSAFMLDVGELQQFATHLFFLLTAELVGVSSAALMDGLRFMDFKQRRKLEESRDHLKEMDVQKSRFTANIHHELRTPLTLTLAPLEAMLGGEFGAIPDVQRGYLKTMHSNGLRLLKLINNLLDLAKIEGRQMRVTRRAMQVGGLVEEIAAGARPLAERKGVRIETAGLDGLPEIHADREAVEKVVVNLLGNALKFTDSGGRIGIEGTREEGGGIHLVVADTGAGIPGDQLERIFDRFAQADGSATRRYEGTGIGLALVKELVELHGGRIWAESDGPGHGARFHAVLPQGEADAPPEEEALETSAAQLTGVRQSLADLEGTIESEQEGEGGPELRLLDLQRNVERHETSTAELEPVPDAMAAPPPDAPEVLVAEDNPDMRRLMGFLLGREFRVRVTRNGREALEALRDREPDLVLTDVMMPELSGTELCRAIKEDPGTRRIPVVLVTSKAEREMKIEGLELGADDYVTKPFHPRELLARVRSLVKLRLLARQVEERNRALEIANERLERALEELRETQVQLVQAERLSAVGELAAGVAHEVNNPINFASNALGAIRTQVEDLRRAAAAVAELDFRERDKLEVQLEEFQRLWNQLGLEQLEEELGELVAIVTEGLDRTRRLVGDLRDLAAPGPRRESEVDVARGLRSTLQLLGHALREAEIDLDVRIPDTLPRVPGDPRALNQVFLNLMKNAAEALDGRGGTISVAARPDDDSVVVEVGDDGPGIDPEVQMRLFDPFFSTKEAGRGTGLGLSISRRIVLEHGGALDVRSAPGRGTTFTLRLPRRPDPGCQGDEGSGHGA